jgi:hypothetical protein
LRHIGTFASPLPKDTGDFPARCERRSTAIGSTASTKQEEQSILCRYLWTAALHHTVATVIYRVQLLPPMLRAKLAVPAPKAEPLLQSSGWRLPQRRCRRGAWPSGPSPRWKTPADRHASRRYPLCKALSLSPLGAVVPAGSVSDWTSVAQSADEVELPYRMAFQSAMKPFPSVFSKHFAVPLLASAWSGQQTGCGRIGRGKMLRSRFMYRHNIRESVIPVEKSIWYS